MPNLPKHTRTVSTIAIMGAITFFGSIHTVASGADSQSGSGTFSEIIAQAFDAQVEKINKKHAQNDQKREKALEKAISTATNLEVAYTLDKLPNNVIDYVEKNEPTLSEFGVTINVTNWAGNVGDCLMAAKNALYECTLEGGESSCCFEEYQFSWPTCVSGASGKYMDGSLWAAACSTEGGILGGTAGGEEDSEEECENQTGTHDTMETIVSMDDGSQFLVSCDGVTEFAWDESTGVCFEGWNVGDCTRTEIVTDGVGAGEAEDDTVEG
jgi:hypothetical protein